LRALNKKFSFLFLGLFLPRYGLMGERHSGWQCHGISPGSQEKTSLQASIIPFTPMQQKTTIRVVRIA
jgi:hypothetical protein